MNPGRLREVIAIEQLTVGSPQQKPSGEPDESWTAYISNVSAGVETLRGRELFQAQEHHAEAAVRFRVRWRAGITANMRILHRGLYYNIVFVPPADRSGKQHDMELLTTQGVNVG